MTAEWITEKAKNFGLASFKSWNLMDGYATTVAASKSQDIASLSATPTDLKQAGEILVYVCNLDNSKFTAQTSRCHGSD
jgi:hypothetical protein